MVQIGAAKRAQQFFKPRNATKHAHYVLNDEEAGNAGTSPAMPTT